MINFANSCADLVTDLNVNAFMAPAFLGAVGGWGSGIGPQRGFLQGLVTAGFSAVVLSPIKNAMDRNTDWSNTKKDQIHTNLNYLIRITGVISSFVVPILFMNKYGDKILGNIASILPSQMNSWILPQRKIASFKLGVYTNILPDLLSFYLSFANKL